MAGSQTVDRALELLTLVAKAPPGGLRLADLAEAGGLDRATAHRLLTSLLNRNFVEQDTSSKRYSLGLEFFSLGTAASNRYDLSAQARHALSNLSESTGDTAIFCLRNNFNLVCVHVETGDSLVKAIPMDIGSQKPIGTGSASLALLSVLPELEARRVLERNMDRISEAPGRDIASILMEVTECRNTGYAIADEDPNGNILGVSVPIISRNKRPIGTITVCGIHARFKGNRLKIVIDSILAEQKSLDENMPNIRKTATGRS